MLAKGVKEKGFLAKLLEKGIKIWLKKECKKIAKIKIDIIATSIQIIKGIIQSIHINAEDINYKDLLFDEIKLEANEVKINFKLENKELKFKNNFTVRFRISLSQNSLKTILFSNNWSWIGSMISKELLNQKRLEGIKIKNDQILIEASDEKNTNYKEEKVNLKAKNGKIFLENKNHNKSFQIPIEDKVFIKNLSIHNGLIIITANSSISFN